MGAFSGEIPADIVLGRIDSVDQVEPADYYRILDCGLRLPLTDGAWQPLAAGEMLVLRGGEIIERVEVGEPARNRGSAPPASLSAPLDRAFESVPLLSA